jgi:hypothetical protein
VDKGEALAELEPLLERATRIGIQVIGWYGVFEMSELDAPTLILNIRKVSPAIDAIADECRNLPFPPRDVKDCDKRALSPFAHLINIVLHYSERGIEMWSEKEQTFLMHRTVKDFRADLDRLNSKRENFTGRKPRAWSQNLRRFRRSY